MTMFNNENSDKYKKDGTCGKSGSDASCVNKTDATRAKATDVNKEARADVMSNTGKHSTDTYKDDK